MNGGFTGQLAEAFKPHVGVLGGQIKNSQDRVISLLEGILEGQTHLAQSGRPEWSDLWSYCDFSFSGAQATPAEFAVPVIVPRNEVWLVQNVIVNAATLVTMQTDGGQLRGTFNVIGTYGVGGDVAWLPGEHILITAAAAVTGTVGVIRRLGSFSTRRGFTGPSNEMVAGRSNTHSTHRDNLDQQGIYVDEVEEIRATEGLERSEAPVVAVPSVERSVSPFRSLKTITADPTEQ